MRKKTAPRPIERPTHPSPRRALVSSTSSGSILPTAAALAAALFAVQCVGCVGCGARATDDGSIRADDHDRGRVVASSEDVKGSQPQTASVPDGVKAGMGTPIDPKPIDPLEGKPMPVPVGHAGKVKPIKPKLVSPPMPGGMAPMTMAPSPPVKVAGH